MNKKNLLIISIIVLIVIIITIVGVSVFIKTDCAQTTILKTPSLENKLSGKKWTWGVTLMNNDTNTIPRQRDAFTITFNEDGSFDGETDCNNFFGQYEREGNKISFGPIAMTRMYCEDSQESEFTQSLSEVDQFMFDENDNLILLMKLDSGSMLFQDKDSEYNNQKWDLIKKALEECQVKEAGQTHGREVSIELKNGQKIKAFEPKIDDIFDLVNQVKEKCGKINLWTE